MGRLELCVWVSSNSWLVHYFPVLKPACSFTRRCSTTGAILYGIIRSYSVYVWHKRDIGLWFFGIAEYFPDEYGDNLG